MRSSHSPICVMSSSASSQGRPRPTSSALCCPGLGRPHRPRPPSRADAREAVATLTANGAIITLMNPNSVHLIVTSDPAGLVQWVQGTGVLTINGVPKSVTITGPLAATQQPTGGAQTAPAAP